MQITARMRAPWSSSGKSRRASSRSVRTSHSHTTFGRHVCGPTASILTLGSVGKTVAVYVHVSCLDASEVYMQRRRPASTLDRESGHTAQIAVWQQQAPRSAATKLRRAREQGQRRSAGSWRCACCGCWTCRWTTAPRRRPRAATTRGTWSASWRRTPRSSWTARGCCWAAGRAPPPSPGRGPTVSFVA